MTEVPAHPDRPAGAMAPGGGPPDAPKPPDGGWSRQRWLLLIALMFAIHIVFIFALGEHKQIVPRRIVNRPVLELTRDSTDLLALTDPTLFALPHQSDFGAAEWMMKPNVKQPSFRWTEEPRWLAISDNDLGAVFRQFMQTNVFATYSIDFKPAPQVRIPVIPDSPMLAETSTLELDGGLAQRELASTISLTNWPYADVIAPSVVQVLVDPGGAVISTVLVPPGIGFVPTDQYDAADQRALEIARTLRFKPAPELTVGRIIFNWHTVPLATTNEPSH